ncbi:MAG: T9SS type A sorting domain-containing protein [Ignavibacteriaceae bacterium]|nr:T9SS type A sorting domain-containing protein [Ignavibacteriaceae bacterium]
MKNSLLAFLFVLSLSAGAYAQEKDFSTLPKSDVFLQGFYWNSTPGGIWWDSLASLAPRLASSGFSAVWFPNAVKGAAGGFSMGYDPYDHYDFGEFNQKGSRETRFGSRAELVNAIRTFTDVGIDCYADAVMLHMNGGEAQIPYECTPYPAFPDSAYLLFNYPNGSGRFPKNASHFYPNAQTCDVNPPYHGPTDPLYQFGEWLAKDKASVRDSLIAWGRYLKQVLGFKGFRLDAVKHIDPAFMGPWLQQVNGNNYAVAEYFGGQGEIISWYNQTKFTHGGNVAVFDFPLRYSLRDMCNNTSGSYDMTWLDGAGLVNAGVSGYDVATFVENHDLDRIGWDSSIANGHDPIIYNKDLAYAYILFSEGRPSVFFKDYFMYGFAGKIDTLIWIRQKYLGGGSAKRAGLNAYYIRQDNNQDQAVLARDIYVARRNGFGTQPGGYLVINDNSSQWIDVWVDTELPVGTVYKEFTGKDANKVVVGPAPGGNKNRVKLWAPNRGYTVYVADTTQAINHPPVLVSVPELTAYTNSPFSYKLKVNDVNGDPLSFSLSGNPAWLSVSASGVLNGTPQLNQTGSSPVIISVSDNRGYVVSDTFNVTVILNRPPAISSINDTTIKATKRLEYQVAAVDPDNDTLSFSFNAAPSWLSITERAGLIVGTPAVEDTGLFRVVVSATDMKGAYDSVSFNLRVTPNRDSVIATYKKPFIDGNVSVSNDDWLADWLIVADSDTDSYWGHPHPDTLNNEILGIYSTWDADSLYLGIDYVINDTYNTMMVYLDAGKAGGITNFNSNQGYNGDYAKNFRFRPQDAIDFFIASYYRNQPSFFRTDSNTSSDITSKINGLRGNDGYGLELAIAWNDLYNLGIGIVPNNIKLKVVGLVAGGFNYGAGDSAPDNPDVNGNAGPDSLIFLAMIDPDKDGNGIPDPTVFISDIAEFSASAIPSEYQLRQNFPNPFNPSTTINYQLPVAGLVTLKIYDILGREIVTLVNEIKQTGSHSVSFNASPLPSGMYLYELRAGDFRQVRKMSLIK